MFNLGSVSSGRANRKPEGRHSSLQAKLPIAPIANSFGQYSAGLDRFRKDAYHYGKAMSAQHFKLNIFISTSARVGSWSSFGGLR
jgi:hypothetical protein